MTKKKVKKKKHIVKKKKPPKKRGIKHSIKKTNSSNKIEQINNEFKIEKMMVENFVGLQKVMTNLSVKLDHLTGKLSKLLELFELSAKALTEKDYNVQQKQNIEQEKQLIEKMDQMLDQNKIIARGLTLVHEKIPEPYMAFQQNQSKFEVPKQPFPRPMNAPQNNPQNIQEFQSTTSGSKTRELP